MFLSPISGSYTMEIEVLQPITSSNKIVIKFLKEDSTWYGGLILASGDGNFDLNGGCGGEMSFITNSYTGTWRIEIDSTKISVYRGDTIALESGFHDYPGLVCVWRLPWVLYGVELLTESQITPESFRIWKPSGG